jgi:hypothetical protein
LNLNGLKTFSSWFGAGSSLDHLIIGTLTLEAIRDNAFAQGVTVQARAFAMPDAILKARTSRPDRRGVGLVGR